MIVVHSCSSESYSGLEQYVVELADYQNKNQKKIKPLLFCREESLIHQNALRLGIPVWTIDKKAKPGPKLWFGLRQKWQQIFSQNEDVVLHMHAGGEPWFHFPRLLQKKTASFKKVLQYHIWITHKKKDPLHWFVFSKIDEVWSSSTSAKTNLLKILPLPEKKMRVVPYGRNVEKLLSIKKTEDPLAVRSRFGLKDGDELAVCVTRFEKIKGVQELFEAFVKVAPRFPKSHLLIVGDASQNNPEALAYTKKLHSKRSALPEEIRSRIHMPGYLKNIESILMSADFYVLPSYEECFSLAMLDSAILGKPILGTDSGGTPSLVLPGETGFLAQPQSAEDLEKGFLKILGNHPLQKKMGEAIAKLALNYNQTSIFLEIEKNYEAKL